MRLSLSPDVNVWLALAYQRHRHNEIAVSWFLNVNVSTVFCRTTQLGLLRLLTNEHVMGVDVLNQRSAWREYHRFFEDKRVGFLHEPSGAEFERFFEKFSSAGPPSTKLWSDAYLAAFATVAGLTLVTFDQPLARRAAPYAQALRVR